MLAAALLATALAAHEPQAPQPVLDLAFVMGESHALRRLCQGEGDLFWRSRMERLLEVEAPPEAAKERLVAAFNAGFAAGRKGFAACTSRASAEAARLARKGQGLAHALAEP